MKLTKKIKKFFKRNQPLFISAIGLGILGGIYYLKEVPREAMIEATSRTAAIDSLTVMSAETKVMVAFVLSALILASLVAAFIEGRKR